MSATHPPITIRPVRPILADATALLAVERRSLGDSPYTPEEALAILRREEHHAYLALAGGRPVGFCSSFETPTDAGPRLELDMLGVHPGYRGRGIATEVFLEKGRLGDQLKYASRKGFRFALIAGDVEFAAGQDRKSVV